MHTFLAYSITAPVKSFGAVLFFLKAPVVRLCLMSFLFRQRSEFVELAIDEFDRFACFSNWLKWLPDIFEKEDFFFSVVAFCPHVNGDFEYQKSRFLKTVPIVEIFGNITPNCQRFRVDGEEKEGFRANTMATLRFRVCTLLKTEKNWNMRVLKK